MTAQDPYRIPDAPAVKSGDPRDMRFEFDVDGHTVVGEGELGSGIERVFVDDELLVEKRSFGLKSRHNFQLDGRDYTLLFKVKHPFTTTVRCSLFRGDTELQRFRCTAKASASIIMLSTLVLLAAMVAFSYLDARFGWPPFAEKIYIVALFGSFIVFGHIATVRGRKKLVKETIKP